MGLWLGEGGGGGGLKDNNYLKMNFWLEVSNVFVAVTIILRWTSF